VLTSCSQAQRTGREYSFSQSLSLSVTRRMPLLRASLEGAPAELLLGETVHATLRLCNEGSMPLSSLRVRLSHPAFCVLGEPLPGGASAPAAAPAPTGAGETLLHTRRPARPPGAGSDPTMATVALPGGQLVPGQSLAMPLWVRAAEAGRHSLHFALVYEPLEPRPQLKRRVCPLSVHVRVRPSLAVEHALRPAHACAQARPPRGLHWWWLHWWW